MKITEITTLAFAIPNKPYVVGHRKDEPMARKGRYLENKYYRAIYSPNAESMVVAISTDAGIVGMGEAQSCILPDVVTRIIDELLAPLLIGADPRNPAVLRDKLYDLMRERGHDSGYLPDAIAAVDMAMWDIAARAADLPLYQMLGGAYRTSMPCYVSGVPASSIDDELARIADWVGKGFTRFKFSYPPTIEAHVEHCAKLRERFGSAIEILIDAHWAFTVRQAIDLGRALEPFAVRWIECPLIPENAANQAEVKLHLRAAHALGEEYRTRYHFKDRLERHAIDIAQPDIGRTGVTEGKRIADLCLAHDVPMAYHVGAGLGVYTAATLHVAAATAMLDLMEYQPSQMSAGEPYYTPSYAPTSGAYPLPPGPGIGVTAKVEELRRFRVQ